MVSIKDHTKLHSINVLENFGESTALHEPSYEYLGDIYAGLDQTQNRSLHKQSKIAMANLLQGMTGKADKTYTEQLMARLEELENDAVTDTSELNMDDDCTVCLYIPYTKFLTLPRNEIARIRNEATLAKLKDWLLSFVALQAVRY